MQTQQMSDNATTKNNGRDRHDNEQDGAKPDRFNLLVGYPHTEQGDTSPQNRARRKLDPVSASLVFAEKVEGHPEEQRVKQRRAAIVIGNKRRRQCDHYANKQPGMDSPVLNGP